MDSEAYSKTIEKMMHSDNVSPIMKKVLEKELHRAKNTSKASESAFTNDEVKEMNEWMKEEKSLIDQASDAIQNVDKHRNTITACESILEQIDPGVAQSKAQEKKITDLQNEIYQLKKDMPTLEDIKTLFMQSMSSSTNNVKKDK